MNSLFFSLFSLFSLASAAQDIGFYNAGLDPAPLKWWQTKWCNNPVELGITNKGLTTTVTFNISPYTTLSLGVLEVTFPTGFDVTSATCSHVTPCVTTVSSQLVSIPSITVTAGTDYSFTIGGVILPSSTGGYGPFALRTRHYTGGQTVDINLNFASVGIFKDRGSLTNLTVTTVSSSIKVRATGSTLSFKFQIAKDLWKNDIFRITASQYWTISTSSTCSTASYSGRINNFNGTRSADPHNFDCYISPKTTPTTTQTIIIYGLNNDIDVSASDDNKYVDLRVTSVSNPDADYSDSSYTWTVETLRGQTKSVIEYATSSSGPSTDPGTLTSASFDPTWGWSSTNVLPSTYIYTNFGFTTVNKIAQGGKAEVLFTDTISVANYDGNSSAGCWLQNYLTYTSDGTTTTAACTAVSKTATITPLPEVSAGTTLTISVLTYFDTTTSSGSASATVTTKNIDGVEIDKASNLGRLILGNSSNNYIPTTFALGISDGTDLLPETQKTDTTTSLAGHTATAETIMFKIDPTTEDFTTNTQITLKFPFIHSTSVQNFEFAIPSSGVTYYLQSQADGTTALTTTIASSSLTTTPSSTGTITNGAGLGSFVFKVVTTPTAGHLTYFAAQGASNTQIRLPQYMSNAATRYEAYLETKDMASTPTLKSQYGVWQIEIISNTFATGVIAFCMNKLEALPIKLVITPNSVDVPTAATSTSYMIELDFTSSSSTTDLGSGLSSGNDYPYRLITSTFSSFTITTGSTPYLKGKLTADIAATLDTSILYTVVSPLITTFAPIVRGYYLIDADPRLEYQTHEVTSTTVDTATTAPTDNMNLTSSQTVKTIGISTAVTSLSEGYLKLKFGQTDNSGVLWAINYPQGWTLVSSVNNGATTVTSIKVTPSSTSTTRYFFTLTTQIFVETGSFDVGTNTELYIKGPVSSNYKVPDADLIFIIYSTLAWSSTTACIDANLDVSATAPHTMTAGTITVNSISPNSIKGRGPASVNLTEVVVFNVAHLIPAGGNIVATVDSGWGVASPAACSVSGLSNQSTTLTVTATLSSTTCTVTNFSEVSANSSITLTFTGLLPPTYTSSTSNTSQTFLSSIVTNFIISGTTYQIDTTSTAVVLTIAAAISTGRSSFVTKKTYPQNAMTTDLDLYLKFALANSVPKAGVLELTSPLTFKISSSNTKNQVWLSPLKYSAVSFSSSTLSITLAEDYTADTILELFIDKAVDNPTSTTTTSTGFTLRSSWGGVTLDTDVSQTLQSTQQFTASEALGSTLTASTSNSLTFSPTTAGEYATYSFNFKSSVKFATANQIWIDSPVTFASGDQIRIEFPNEFDPFLGDFWPGDSDGRRSYYVGCSSPQLDAVLCKVERGTVMLSIPSQLATNALTVSVMRVKNPPASTTGNFRILHMDSQANPKSYNMAFGSVTPTELPKGSELMMVILKNEDASSAVSTLTATFTLEEDIQLKHKLRLLFPPEYELSPAFEVSCTVWVRSRVLKQWAQSESYPTKSCSVTGNSVELPFPTQTVSSLTYDLLKLTLLNAPRPYWGWSLPEDQLDVFLKVSDSDAYHVSYDLLTTSFTVQVFDSTALSIKSSSYPSLGRSFAGFAEKSEQMMVNNYGANTKANFITVQTGSESNPILISLSSPSQSEITLKPSCSLPSLSFHSPSNFTIQAGLSSTTFTVTATASVSGVFFIEWTAYQDGVSSSFYRPPRTLIEVQGLKELYVITVQSPLEVTRGTLSFPFQVSCSRAPALDVSIVISSSPQVTVNPQVITLTRDQPDSSFQVLVDISGYNTALSFNLTGPGAPFFTIDSVLPLNVRDPLNGTISSWGVSACQRTTCVVTPSVTAAGTLYWHLRSKGRPQLSFQELKGRSSLDSAPELVNYFDTLLYSENARRDTQPQSHEGFPDFQARLLRDHLQKDWVGVDVIEVAEFSFSRQFYWLLPDTEYNLTGYLYDGVSTPQPYSETFRTLAAFPTQPFEVNLKEASDQRAKVKELAAKQQGVPAYQLGYADTKGRRLQSGGFSFVLYSDLTNQGQSPTSQAKFSEQGLEEFRASLKAIGVQLDTVGNLPVPMRVTPTWQVTPAVADLNQTAVLVTLQSSVEGKSCCCVEQNSTQAPTAVQVYMGLSAGGQPLASQCVNSNMTGENYIAFYNLTSVADYSLHCVAMDNFPIVPTYMDNVTSLDFQTEAYEDIAGLVSLSLIVLLSI
jgi:hypothetical protein